MGPPSDGAAAQLTVSLQTLEQNPGFTEEEMNEFEQKLAAEMDGKGEELQEVQHRTGSPSAP